MRVKISTEKPEKNALSRAAGKLAAEVLSMIAPHVKAGVSTDELDKMCHARRFRACHSNCGAP